MPISSLSPTVFSAISSLASPQQLRRSASLGLSRSSRSRQMIRASRTWSPHSAQVQILGESRRFNVLACGRRFGKTELGVDRALEAVERGRNVGWFSPTYKLLSEAWRELK